MKNLSVDYYQKLHDLGLQAFLIVTLDGLPICRRIYDNTISLDMKNDQKSIENLTGVMSTLVKFANDLTKSLVTDLGLHTMRIYFDFFSDFLMCIMFNEKRLLEMKLKDIQLLMKGTLSEEKDIFMVHLREQPQDSATEDLIYYRDLMDQINPLLDEILYDSFRRAIKFIES